jgi:hypothetical protein
MQPGRNDLQSHTLEESSRVNRSSAACGGLSTLETVTAAWPCFGRGVGGEGDQDTVCTLLEHQAPHLALSC